LNGCSSIGFLLVGFFSFYPVISIQTPTHPSEAWNVISYECDAACLAPGSPVPPGTYAVVAPLGKRTVQPIAQAPRLAMRDLAANTAEQQRRAFGKMSRGWAIGTAKWRKILAKTYSQMAFNPGLEQLEEATEPDDWKVEVARRLRELSVPYSWISQKLHRGMSMLSGVVSIVTTNVRRHIVRPDPISVCVMNAPDRRRQKHKSPRWPSSAPQGAHAHKHPHSRSTRTRPKRREDPSIGTVSRTVITSVSALALGEAWFTSTATSGDQLRKSSPNSGV
jgi:hypothetical protein